MDFRARCKAIGEGKTLQYQTSAVRDWVDLAHNSADLFDDRLEWRIKPQKITTRMILPESVHLGCSTKSWSDQVILTYPSDPSGQESARTLYLAIKAELGGGNE
jgi:hypothetical protein